MWGLSTGNGSSTPHSFCIGISALLPPWRRWIWAKQKPEMISNDTQFSICHQESQQILGLTHICGRAPTFDCLIRFMNQGGVFHHKQGIRHWTLIILYNSNPLSTGTLLPSLRKASRICLDRWWSRKMLVLQGTSPKFSCDKTFLHHVDCESTDTTQAHLSCIPWLDIL